MNDLTKANGSNLPATAADNANPFSKYGEQKSQTAIVGKLLKFSKGDWLAGQENDLVDDGTTFVANMDQLLVGWIRWQDNKPTDHIMGLVSKNYQAPRRDELGDHDEDAWEVDESTGRPRDPWQESNYLLLQSCGKGVEPELFTFTTSSAGGINAIAKLCMKYGSAMRQRPDQFPVVALNQGSYLHSNKAFGRIKFPVFDIVGYVPKSSFLKQEEEGDRSGEAIDDEAQAALREHRPVAPPPAAKPGKPKAKARF